MWDKAAGEDFKAYRKKLKLSQGQMAELLGCDQSTVSRIEDGIAPSKPVRRLIDLMRQRPDKDEAPAAPSELARAAS